MSVNPFGRNSVADRAFKKTERLVFATYLVTNHIPTGESLCEELRDNTRSLLLLIAHSDNLFRNKETLSPALLQIRIILSFIDLLFVSNLISDINTNVLKRAYVDFASFLSSSVGSEHAETTNLHGIFDEIAQKDTVVPVVLRDSLKRNEEKRSDGERSIPRTPAVVSKNKKKTRNTSIKSRAISTNRRVVILDMVAKSGKVTVKEVAKQIPDTSPKTLQRELMNLVSEGVLKKEGNKRWTVYTLVRN